MDKGFKGLKQDIESVKKTFPNRVVHEVPEKIRKYLSENETSLKSEAGQYLYEQLLYAEGELKEDYALKLGTRENDVQNIAESYKMLGDPEGTFEVWMNEERVWAEAAKKWKHAIRTGAGEGRTHRDYLEDWAKAAIERSQKYHLFAEAERKHLKGGRSHRETYWKEHEARVRKILEERGHDYATESEEDSTEKASFLTSRGKGKRSLLELLMRRKETPVILGIFMLSILLLKTPMTGYSVLSSDLIIQNQNFFGVALWVIAALVTYLIVKRNNRR